MCGVSTPRFDLYFIGYPSINALLRTSFSHAMPKAGRRLSMCITTLQTRTSLRPLNPTPDFQAMHQRNARQKRVQFFLLFSPSKSSFFGPRSSSSCCPDPDPDPCIPLTMLATFANPTSFTVLPSSLVSSPAVT